MPLPGLGANLGKRPANHAAIHEVDQDPVRNTPVQEKHVVDSQNVPYRGAVDHGQGKIKQDYNPDLDPNMWKDDPVKEDVEVDPPTPVPVYIVTGKDKGYRLPLFRAGVVYASSSPNQIIGRHDARRRLILVNTSEADTVWLGHDMGSARSGFGFPVKPGERFEFLTSTQAVYASTLINSVQLAYISEYDGIVP